MCGPPCMLPAKVEPISPVLTLPNFTLEFGYFASTSAGRPDVVGQLPLAAPGPLEPGGVESSQSMSASWSSQRLMTRTIPLPSASPICLSPPFFRKSLGSSNSLLKASHMSSLIELYGLVPGVLEAG